MAKSGKTQQSQAQPQKKGGLPNPKQTKDKPSRGCCGCIFSLVRKLIVLTAISSFLYVATFTGYTYHVKQRVPTVDEFKAFSLESYKVGSDKAREYFAVADKHAKVYYAHFEKEYLPTIQVYTKKYTKLAVEKAGDLKEISVKYFAIAQKQVEAWYKLLLKKVEEFQSGKASEPAPSPTKAPKVVPTSTTAKPEQKVVPTAAPTPKPTVAPAKPTQKVETPKPVTTPKPAPTKKPDSREKKEL